MIKYLNVCLLLLAGSSAQAHNPATPPVASAGNYDIVYHRISFKLNPASSGKIDSGAVTTYFKTTASNVSSLQFDMDCNALKVDSVRYHKNKLSTFSTSTSTS